MFSRFRSPQTRPLHADVFGGDTHLTRGARPRCERPPRRVGVARASARSAALDRPGQLRPDSLAAQDRQLVAEDEDLQEQAALLRRQPRAPNLARTTRGRAADEFANPTPSHLGQRLRQVRLLCRCTGYNKIVTPCSRLLGRRLPPCRSCLWSSLARRAHHSLTPAPRSDETLLEQHVGEHDVQVVGFPRRSARRPKAPKTPAMRRTPRAFFCRTGQHSEDRFDPNPQY